MAMNETPEERAIRIRAVQKTQMDKKSVQEEYKIPLPLVLNERVFEKVFKDFFSNILLNDRIDNRYLIALNRDVQRILVHGFKSIDFNDARNVVQLENFVSDVWSRFRPVFKKMLYEYNRSFTKKKIIA